MSLRQRSRHHILPTTIIPMRRELKDEGEKKPVERISL
jgi:hypothetical protein